MLAAGLAASAAAAAAGAAAAGAGAAQGTSESDLTVGELTQLLSEAGVDFRDCVEKTELVERLRQARPTMPAHLKERLSKLLERIAGAMNKTALK